VYDFSQGDKDQKDLLGGKGANLAEMTRLGLPVPPGFTITTEACREYLNLGTEPGELRVQVTTALRQLEDGLGRQLGDRHDPLLVSVRSGAKFSMPGMMETVLNVGLNDASVKGLAEASGDERFAWDSYRRLLQMFGKTVLDMPGEVFSDALDKAKSAKGAVSDVELDVEDLKGLVQSFKDAVRQHTGAEFPQHPREQLDLAIRAVFNSWNTDRARLYRRRERIPQNLGTAVNVCTMVFGNLGETSGTGVAFTRDPASGKAGAYGDYLANAQGEDVVAGVRTPEPVAKLKDQMPKSYAELMKVRSILEKHFKDVQDIEFTVQEGKLFMLQTRNGKRTSMAALKFSMDMVKEKLITWETAILRNPADQLDQLLAPVFDLTEVKKAVAIASGLPAGPGAASGKVYFNADRAAAAAHAGEKVLLVRSETSPEDLRGMIASEGILTAKGGVSSHAALVARQMGKVCVCGASALEIDYAAKTVRASGKTIREGEDLSIDGTIGAVYAGAIRTAPSEIIAGLVHGDRVAIATEKFQSFLKLMQWCAKVTKLQVRTNADTPDQTKIALAFGAVGIGLTRTEHMFFEGDRIDAMREMILAENVADRKKALAKLLPYQREDFTGIFKALNGFPATIRFLDPPLHEFVPHEGKAQADLAAKLGIPVEKIAKRVEQLHEFNPMLGHRGCRLGISYPEITEMQARAVFEAAADVMKLKIKVKPELMIPLVGFKKELDLQVEVVHRVAKQVMAEKKVKLNYMVGTMIEVPRGALTADEIAQTAEFFSFGTNDLTQTCLGMSRDDSGSFLPPYTELEIVKKNPFASIDQTGVGQLMKIAAEKGNKTRPGIKLGICGEHGGDPESVKFCHRIGLTYVSCSPYRVPVARLAAAQAALEEEVAKKAKKK